MAMVRGEREIAMVGEGVTYGIAYKGPEPPSPLSFPVMASVTYLASTRSKFPMSQWEYL